MTTKEIIAAFERGARENRRDPFRDGNLIHLSPPGSVFMTGDLHGNDRNFDRLCRAAQLALHPRRHLILHELLHNTTNQSVDQCDSYLLLARAAQLKIDFPHQVHFLLSNLIIPPISFRECQGYKTISPALLWERINNTETPQLYPVFPWGIYGVGKPDLEIAVNTWKYDPDAVRFRSHVGWKQDNIIAARLGLTREAAE